MPKVICVDCQVEYVPAKNGAVLIEHFTDEQLPYKIWNVDALRCPVCGTTILAGFANQPFAVHYQTDFEEVLKRVKESETAKNGWVIHAYEHRYVQGACTCGAWSGGDKSTQRHPIHGAECPASFKAFLNDSLRDVSGGLDEGVKAADEQLNHDRLLDAMDGGGE